jgi:hypothetical protein
MVGSAAGENKPIAVEDISLKVSNAARELMKVTGMSFVDARSRVLEIIEQTKTAPVIKENEEYDQTLSDGNYCNPSAQYSSIYTPFTGVEVDALLNQSRHERGVRGRFVNEELKGDVNGDQEAEA